MTLDWYPRNMGKYARKTSGLSMQQHGAYNLLIDHYYSTGPIPAWEHCLSNASSNAIVDTPLLPDHSSIYRVCRAITKSEQTDVDLVLRKFFTLRRNGFYHHKECDETIEKQTKKHETRVRVGTENQLRKEVKKHLSIARSNTGSNAIQNQNQNLDLNKSSSPENKSARGKRDFLKFEGDSDLDFVRSGFDVSRLLGDDAIMEARSYAPGWDIEAIMADYSRAVRDGKLDLPKNPERAFPAWVKAVKKGRRPK